SLVALLFAGCAAKPPAPVETVDLVTPLPNNFLVQLPPAEVPRPLAQFSGIWKGDWLIGDPGTAPAGILHHTLVVVRIEPSSPPGDYHARVVYSTGAPPAMWPDGGPGFWEFWATLSTDGALRMKAPGPDGGQVVYTVADDGKALKGEYTLPGKSINGT